MEIQLLCTDSCVSEVITKYADLVFRLCIVYLKNKADAEDAFQDIFIKLYKKNGKFNDEEHIKAWLIRCTTNHCKNILASHWNRFRTPIDDLIIPIEDKQDNELSKYVMKLPFKYKAVIYLYYYEGYNSLETSKILNIKEATVRTHLKRGREILKKELTNGGFEYEGYQS
jgi:RNA polymerase sigma factor (sigma-70 family)